MIVIGYAGLNLNFREGFKFREFSKHNTKKELGEDGQWAGSFSGCDNYLTAYQLELFRCAKDNRDEPTLAIIGDSKAAALAAGLFRTSGPGGRWLMLTSRGGGDYTFIPILSSASLYELYNPEIPKTALVVLKSHPEISTIVVAVATRHLFQLTSNSSLAGLENSPHSETVEKGLMRFVYELIRLNKRVILLIDNPTLPHPEDCMVRKYSGVALKFFAKDEGESRCVISYD